MQPAILYPYLNLIGLIYLSNSPGDLIGALVSLFKSKSEVNPTDKEVVEALKVLTTSWNALNDYTLDKDHSDPHYEFIHYCKAKLMNSGLDPTIVVNLLSEEPIVGLYSSKSDAYLAFCESEDEAFLYIYKEGLEKEDIRYVFMDRFDWVKIKYEMSISF